MEGDALRPPGLSPGGARGPSPGRARVRVPGLSSLRRASSCARASWCRGCDWLSGSTAVCARARSPQAAAAAMAAKSFAARLRRSRRFLSGFVAGAVVGAAGAGLTALQFLGSQGTEAALAAREPDGKLGPGFRSPTQVWGVSPSSSTWSSLSPRGSLPARGLGPFLSPCSASAPHAPSRLPLPPTSFLRGFHLFLPSKYLSGCLSPCLSASGRLAPKRRATSGYVDFY